VSRAVVHGAALALAVLVAGCGGHDWNGLWHDDFETVCDGAPCGWTQVAGPAGAVTWTETGPGEHGLAMVGVVAVSISPEADEVAAPAPVSSLKAHVVARCDRGAELTLIVSVRSAAGGLIDASGSATFPSEWDGTRSTFDLFANDSTSSSLEFNDIVGIVLHKEGAGACEVDYVSLSDRNVPFPE
jgi:hypothetical protein